MQIQSALTFLVAIAAATPALAQGCRGSPIKKDISCITETINGQCDTTDLVPQCQAGQFTEWVFLRNRCDTVGVCEYQYRCCARR
ncbi:hypothetical protein F5X68DRAFT_213306 [Plectosphaerella plurivora]|uniref:Uncharacterized protein n=1 Tax=Plectosphaerella plurivora TaxID=936078 RepID=A0A9P8V741_9PEZI|nr:hypothetical protein F5X68DRAFT_213306 [Plectosphaerella plurivora]